MSEKIPGLVKTENGDETKENVDVNSSNKGVKGDNMEEWKKLANMLKSGKIDDQRSKYEKLLRRFPFAENYWVEYCKRELEARNYSRVDALLKRTLLSLQSVKLWLFYLEYVTKRKLGPDSEAARNPRLEKSARDEVENAFKYALDNIGFAYEAGSIWLEYISFIKRAKCDSQFELGARALAIKDAYHRAIKCPIQHLETLYAGLQEQGSVVTEIQTEYMKAKGIYEERKKRMDLVAEDILPKPPGDDVDEARTRLQNWKSIIEYELKNPERVSEAGHLKNRVRYIYRKALTTLYFYPELWYDFCQYELKFNDPVSAKTILDQALKAIPSSLMLHFVAADFNESEGRVQVAREIYNNLETRFGTPLVYIQFQLFERRTSGIAAAREVFRRARQSPKCESTVFIASALLEFHNNKDHRVARNVFELGMKRFPGDVFFIIHYLKFLEHLNKDNDIIELYERALQQIEKKFAYPIWERYREFCSRFLMTGGGLKQLMDVEKRMAEAYPEKVAFLENYTGMVHRYAYLGQNPQLPADLSFYSRNKQLSFGAYANVSLDHSISSGNADPSLQLIVGGPDSSKTPAIIRRLEALLPSSLGEGVTPMPIDYMISQIENFTPPPPDFFSRKKRQQTHEAMKANEDHQTDIFKKRRKLA